jgi:hypothetical protein
VKPDCRIEISYIDPDVYASLINHDMRKSILRVLWSSCLYSPTTKQDLARELGIGYHQLIYQLNNHLSDFWTVVEEEKVRGTRKEYIEPVNRHAIFITLGSEKSIFMVDPMANLFGPLREVGLRCDSCTREEAETCMRHMGSNPDFDLDPGEGDLVILERNGRRPPWRPLDIAILDALRGVASNRRFVVSIPCASCAFLNRKIRIDGLESP